MKGAELSSIRHGMDFCLQLGLKDICVFSYSVQAVDDINGFTEDLSPSGALLVDIKTMLDSNPFISVHHMWRSAIRVAPYCSRRSSVIS